MMFLSTSGGGVGTVVAPTLPNPILATLQRNIL